MDHVQSKPVPLREAEPEAPSIEVRGLGLAVTAAALRALLDPGRREEAEVVVDLAALSIRLPADAVAEVAKRLAPDLAVELGPADVTVRVPEQPKVRVSLPTSGVRVRVDAEGVRVGVAEPPGSG